MLPALRTDNSQQLKAENTTNGMGILLSAAEVISNIPVSEQFSFEAIFRRLQSADLELCLNERISLFVLHNVFALVVEAVTGLAEKRISSLEASPSPFELLALRVVRVVAFSHVREILIPFYYRPLIARAGIRCKLSVSVFMKRYTSLT